jgi:hypothetical protein
VRYSWDKGGKWVRSCRNTWDKGENRWDIGGKRVGNW